MDASGEIALSWDFMGTVFGWLGFLCVALGILVIFLYMTDAYPLGLVYGAIALGSGLACLAVAAVIGLLKDIRDALAKS